MRNVVLAKVEDTYGVDAAPTGAADAQVVYDWNPRPQIYDDIRRNIERPFAGAKPKSKTRGRQGHPLKLELCGSGDADTPTRWGSVWLRSARFAAPVVTAGVEVAYPIITTDDDGASLSLHGFKRRARHRCQGYRSNAKFVFVAGQLPGIELDGLGLLNQQVDDAAPGAITLPDYPAPIEVNTDNTTFSLGGFAAKLRSIEIDMRNKTAYRDIVGQRAVIFETGEDGDGHAAGGQLVIEADLALKNYLTDVPARTNLPLVLIHGTEAGNIVDISSNVLQLDEISWSEEQNRLMMSASFDLVPTAAGNELTIKTR